ncbi:MAG: hypothetical protein H6729_15800 [Deltaproteobacteria bacterium]|nr:hypothetical protein [Deltaproteobacteria bacterium]
MRQAQGCTQEPRTNPSRRKASSFRDAVNLAFAARAASAARSALAGLLLGTAGATGVLVAGCAATPAEATNAMNAANAANSPHVVNVASRARTGGAQSEPRSRRDFAGAPRSGDVIADRDSTARDAHITATLDRLEATLTPAYIVATGDGKTIQVHARPAFRMNGGAKQSTPTEAKSKISAALSRGGVRLTGSLREAILRNAYGRPTPEQLKAVTQALIDTGAHVPFLPSTEATRREAPFSPDEFELAIRRMQWSFGLGIDCNGAVQDAFLAVTGRPINQHWGDALIGRSPPNLRQVPLKDARPGDVLRLNAIGGGVGHNVILVRRGTVSAQRAAELSPNYPFSGPLIAFEVLSSWGAGGDPDEPRGGLGRRTWTYDPISGIWGTLFEGQIAVSKTKGPYGHTLVGIYRPNE